jgi:hypothetical protein
VNAYRFAIQYQVRPKEYKGHIKSRFEVVEMRNLVGTQ